MPIVITCETTDGMSALETCESTEGMTAVEACPEELGLACNATWFNSLSQYLDVVEWEAINGTNTLGCGIPNPRFTRIGTPDAWYYTPTSSGGANCWSVVFLDCAGNITVNGQYCSCSTSNWYNITWSGDTPIYHPATIERLEDGNYRITVIAYRRANPSLPPNPAQWDFRCVFETDFS